VYMSKVFKILHKFLFTLNISTNFCSAPGEGAGARPLHPPPPPHPKYAPESKLFNAHMSVLLISTDHVRFTCRSTRKTVRV